MRRGLCPAKLKIGKPDRNFAFSTGKPQNPCGISRFPRRKCQIPRSISLFLRSISDFPCGKYEMPSSRERIRTICRSRRDDNCEDMDEVYAQPREIVTLDRT